jgi:hypothetical protein
MATWDDVRAAGLALPECEESTSYGTPALKARGKLMCRLRTGPDALVVRVLDEGDKRALLQSDPAVFFTTPHYDGAAYVLVRLEAVGGETLGELIEDAWRTVAPKRLVAAYEAERG